MLPFLPCSVELYDDQQEEHLAFSKSTPVHVPLLLLPSCYLSVSSSSFPHPGRQETHLVVLVSRSRVKGAGPGWAGLLS